MYAIPQNKTYLTTKLFKVKSSIHELNIISKALAAYALTLDPSDQAYEDIDDLIAKVSDAREFAWEVMEQDAVYD